MASRSGRRTFSTFGFRPDQIPSGMPITTHTATAISINANVCRLRSHRSISPRNVNPATASSALRHPATTKATAPAPTITPRNVIRSNSRSRLSYTLSETCLIGLKK